MSEEGRMAKRKGSENNDDRRKKKKTETTGSEQLRFFVNEFQSAKDVQLSSIELESLKADSSILELSNCQNSGDTDLDVKLLGGDIKGAFGNCWRQVLCESEVVEGKIPPGSPSVLIVSPSALRSIHLLKGFRFMTKQCSAVKLFSKHIKLQEQISLLKNRVNIASGTPSRFNSVVLNYDLFVYLFIYILSSQPIKCRIKKLIDVEALGLSRLQLLVLDIHPDVKGYSLFTLPQVRCASLLSLPPYHHFCEPKLIHVTQNNWLAGMNSGTCSRIIFINR